MLESNLLRGKGRVKSRLVLSKPLTLPDTVTADFAPWFDYSGADNPILMSRSANCPQLSKSAKIPQSLIPGNSNDFILTATVTLSNQNAQALMGNLLNGSGSGTFWITLNNTYVASTLIAFDGYDTGGGIWRARFGSGKLTINTPHTIRLERKGNVLSCMIDGISYPDASMPKGFSLTSATYPLYVGNSVDGAYPLTGTVGALDYTIYN